MEATGETAGLRQTLLRLRGRACAECSEPLCDHWLLCAIALGLKDAPRCAVCAAKGLSRTMETMRGDLARWLRSKDCFSRVWREADASLCPVNCSWAPLLAGAQGQNPLDFEDGAEFEWPLPPVGSGYDIASTYDFGDMACGELVLELRRRMRELPAGAVVRVIATDPAAPEDIPAWTRLCAHTLLAAHPPHYDLRKRFDR